MATLLAWTTIEIGDLQIFAPTLPCLVVNTWYIDDDQPDSTVTYFWQDEATGLVNHELVFRGACRLQCRACMGAGACSEA